MAWPVFFFFFLFLIFDASRSVLGPEFVMHLLELGYQFYWAAHKWSEMKFIWTEMRNKEFANFAEH